MYLKLILFLILTMFYWLMPLYAQDAIPKIKNATKIEMLEQAKLTIQEQERTQLKQQVIAINKLLEQGSITTLEAENLKKEAAKTAALNIENRVAIVNNKIALLKRNQSPYAIGKNDSTFINIDTERDTSERIVYVHKSTNKIEKNIKYDRRTTSSLVLALGFNNALVQGEKFDNSPYKFGGSRFLEMGWAWKTRVFQNTNAMRLKYGVSLQINGLKAADNNYFVQNNNLTTLEPFEHDLKKSKLSISNLVFPVHFEFGPSKKIEHENYFRYSTSRTFKFAFGAYGGFNVGTRHKLKYTANGNREKTKQKTSFNTSNLVYGLSSYIAFGDVGVYLKYDLSPIFKSPNTKQNNISLGIRFDVD